jgi:hypothetical protein
VVDFDGNNLHGTPILSQLRPKVTSHIVNYADDFVTRCHRKTAEAQAQEGKDEWKSSKKVSWRHRFREIANGGHTLRP